MKYDAIVVASGKGRRAGLGFNKVFYRFKDGETVLDKALKNFLADPDCLRLIVVTNQEDFSLVPHDSKIILVQGGKERIDSVHNGLNKVEAEYVLIHDGARPFLSKEDLEKLKAELPENDGAILGNASIETVKEVRNGYIEKTLDRQLIFGAKTPQGFRTDLYKKCYENIGEQKFTDDASLMEANGYRIKMIEGDPRNIKLTNPEDFE